MTIDIERLKVDREYWDSVAPEGANRYYINAHYRCFLKHSSPDHLYHLSGGEWWPIPRHAIQSHLDTSVPRPEPRQVEWDGSGLPPVGSECEINTEYGYLPCRIVSHGEDYVVAHIHPNEHNLKVDWTRHGCRPIRTKEQREVDEMVGDIVSHYEYPKGAEGYINLAESLIAAGWRKDQ